MSITFGKPCFVDDEEQEIEKYTYLTLYGSDFVRPKEKSHDMGDSFKKTAIARNKINENKYPNENCIIEYTPSDFDFFKIINSQKSIKRLDIYCHGWTEGLNLGGFLGKREIEGTEIDGDSLDWKSQEGNIRAIFINKIKKIDASVFTSDTKIFFWGCNIGGRLDNKGNHIADDRNKDPKSTFAQSFAEHIGKGEVYALVGKGNSAGSMLKMDEKGKPYYEDGELLPANISFNYKNKNTKKLKAIDYMKKFPLE